MLAIVAAVIFAIALIVDLADADLGGIGVSALVTAGLLCLALHMAGVGTGVRTRGRWRAGRR